MSGNKDKLIAFNYFGGKFVWLEYLYDNFPPHFTHLIDLFAGSLCVSLNYRGRVIRTANEINGEITNFFEILRDHEEELIRRLSLTPHSELEYLNSWGNTNSGKIEQARRFYVRARQSFYGLGAQAQSKGWHMTKQHVNAQGGETISRWNNGIGKLHTVAAEIRKNFQITNTSYDDCIDRLDFPGAFFYCDPPYPLASRNSQNDYHFDFTDDDHRALAARFTLFNQYRQLWHHAWNQSQLSTNVLPAGWQASRGQTTHAGCVSITVTLISPLGRRGEITRLHCPVSQ